MAEQLVDIYTDGACSGNPGPGGWGAVLRYGSVEKELHGGETGETTNNRMELMAPIQALSSLTRPVSVRLYTDSKYVLDGITKWVPRWKLNGWQTKGKRPVKNADLWQRLDVAASRHRISWEWVKGHAGHPDNERADQLAVRGMRDALTAAGLHDAVADLAARQAVPPQRRHETRHQNDADAGICQAMTRKGTPCPFNARPSGLCHLHDPAVQCGAITKKGKPCTTATGGGRCTVHQSIAPGGPLAPTIPPIGEDVARIAAQGGRLQRAVVARGDDPFCGLRDDVSPDDVEAAKTPAGAWTKPQLAEWGVPWPPPSGWKARLVSNYRSRGRDGGPAADHRAAAGDQDE